MIPNRKPASDADAWRAVPHELRIEHDDLGRAVRVYVGALDVTHLVARVQTNTTLLGTHVEVVLNANVPAVRDPFPTLDGSDEDKEETKAAA